ncbi:hypothetical protein C8Q73DRAFT_12894 [Cubamyces lactineus]|nr:hypothetical protein C8Q73DRAFT_12894 [Cubamyces lactineus]
MGETGFHQLLFPRHLVLRIDEKGRKKYWDAYCVAVETFLRMKCLESHLTEVQPSIEGDEKGAAQRQWETDDVLCTAVITLNIRGAYPDWLKKSIAEKKPAAALWEELHGVGAVVSSEDDKETKRQGRKKKSGNNELLPNAIFMFFRIIEKL